jgi:plasmid maintenance system antidote protein VapI
MAGAFRQIALLVSQMREWAKTHKVKNTELAGMLGITPQGITEIFKGRNQSTDEQVLVMQELMKARR